jgi:ABC-type multidrug transport system ATPase subunit
VAIVRRGRIAYEGTLADLKRDAGTGWRLRTTDDMRALAVCRERPGIESVREAADGIRFEAADEAAVAELSRELVQAGALITALAPEAASLEERFFALTEGEAG